MWSLKRINGDFTRLIFGLAQFSQCCLHCMAVQGEGGGVIFRNWFHLFRAVGTKQVVHGLNFRAMLFLIRDSQR